MTPSELSDLLWAQVDRVAPHLLPNGKKDGHEWVAGNVNGDKGNSLKVNLSGKKKWADFAEGDGGDMLDLWMACRGINLHQAMQEAKAFLGIREDDHHFDARREKRFSRPDRKKIARYVTRTESHLEYLQSRGISPEVAKRYEVVSGKVWNGERELSALVFPYKRDGELLQVKRISTERPDGKKVIMAEGDCEPCLFGWQALDAGVRAVVLCEGEIDCMSYAQYGIPALSVPFGGGKGAKQQWIEFEYHNLDRFEEIFISMDVDDVGREAAREIASRLGEHRCRLVTLPHKDINECLMNGVTEDEIWQYIGTASYFDPEELYSAREFYQDTINAFYGKQQYLFNPPWETLAYNFQFREAELTLVNGVNGHGKTEVVGHMALEAMRQGVKTCVASLELKPGVLLKRLTRQSTCCKTPPVLEIESAFKFYDDRLWLFGLTGSGAGNPAIGADVRSRLTGKEQRQLYNSAQRIQGRMQNQGVAAARDMGASGINTIAEAKMYFQGMPQVDYSSPEAMQQSIREIQEYTNNYNQQYNVNVGNGGQKSSRQQPATQQSVGGSYTSKSGIKFTVE